MKVTLIKYRLDISNESEGLEYMRICAAAKKLGHKLFDSISSRNYKYYEKLPVEQTIETEFLFDDQYNTVEGFRIFDWAESIYRNRNIKEGYYIATGIEELTKLKASQLKCGYCGKRYDKSKTSLIYCNSCLDSKHLEEKDLPLLRLQTLTGEKQGGEVPKQLTKAFHTAKKAWEEGQLDRMQKRS